ncbi:hypothetical protein TWF281_011273 [Arthrobotrys megalospora]
MAFANRFNPFRQIKINRPSPTDIRRRTNRFTNRFGIKSWTVPILLPLLKILWPTTSGQLNWTQVRLGIPPPPASSAVPKNPSITSTTGLNSTTTATKMNSGIMAPVLMVLMVVNQYIDTISQSILDILYSFAAGTPILNTLLLPIDLLLRVRIHVVPRKSFFGGLLGGCMNVTGGVVMWFALNWLYHNFTPFRRVVTNIRRRLRRFWRHLQRFDILGALAALVKDPGSSGTSYGSSSVYKPQFKKY